MYVCMYVCMYVYKVVMQAQAMTEPIVVLLFGGAYSSMQDPNTKALKQSLEP